MTVTLSQPDDIFVEYAERYRNKVEGPVPDVKITNHSGGDIVLVGSLTIPAGSSCVAVTEGRHGRRR